PDNGRADVRRPFGLVGAARKIEEHPISLFFNAHVNPHRIIKIDAVAIDKAFTLAAAVRPGSDLAADFGFRQREELIIRCKDRFFTVALHHLLKTFLAKARGAYLAPQVAD